MSGNIRTGNGETQLTQDHPTLRRRLGVVAGLLGALAVTVAAHPAEAARHASHHASHASHPSHEGSRTTHEGSGGPPYAAIVVDGNSGNVLHSANADELRHPASLTKIMTLYLLFERLEAGKLRLDSALPVSEHASIQAPTKLGLKPEQTIQVVDAIGGLVTKSANDAAVVIAEAIGGDEHEFAELMTRKAHALGMSRTIYRNASGLPNDEQVTTARDQATLGRAIQERFPRYYRYFATPSYTYHGQTMRNHNHLLGHVEGLDGIKTGYTQASGFNLVTSVRRNNRHIVAVVLGGASAGARDARMRSLIEEYVVVASAQKNTAFAEAAPQQTTEPRPAETRAVETRATEPRATEPVKSFREARAAKQTAPAAPQAPATYSVASYGRPVTWPAPSAVPTAPAAPAPVASAPVAANPQTGSPLADTAPTAAVPVAKTTSPAAEPIRPIPVKTVNVKLPQVAALGATSITPAPEPVAAPQVKSQVTSPVARQVAPQAQVPAPPSPPPVAAAMPLPSQPEPAAKPAAPAAKAGMLGALPFREVPTVTEPKREPVREAAREALPSAPPQTAPLQAAAPQTAAPAAPLPRQAAANQSAPSHSAPSQAAHTGWIIQVGAFDGEREALQKLSAVQAKAGPLLGRASPFTEQVVRGDKTLYRARFAGLQKDEAEAACRQLKRNDIDCMTIKN
jgi:D-alanyl-D-alanine carboxypeptidase